MRACVLCVCQGVGKSCIVLRYVKGVFDPGNKITVGASFLSKSVQLPEGKTVKLEIWCAFAGLPIGLM